MDTTLNILGTQTSPVELVAVLFGLMSVWSMKKESILAYPFGIVNVLIYVYICYSAKLYAYAGINVFYAVMSAYGWYNWSRKRGEEGPIRITKLKASEIWIYVLLIGAFFVILRILLVKLTDSVVPTWDALTTSVYIIGMWLLAFKKVENWILWIIGDLISIGLFIFEGLYFSSFQFFVFTIIATLGFLEWRKKMLARQVS